MVCDTVVHLHLRLDRLASVSLVAYRNDIEAFSLLLKIGVQHDTVLIDACVFIEPCSLTVFVRKPANK